jgi:hypothetical protein
MSIALASTRGHLLRGSAADAWTTGQEALMEARAKRDRHLEARALVMLGRAATLESRFRSAYNLALRGSELLSAESDAQSEADAQLVASYAAAALGMTDISVLAAESARWHYGIAASLRHAEALNYAGVAHFWNADYGQSANALEAALVCASASFTRPVAFQPLVNLAFCEFLLASSPDASKEARRDELEFLSWQVERLVRADQLESLSVVSPRVALLLARIIWALVAWKRGKVVGAQMHLSSFEREVRILPEHSWLNALPWLVRCVGARLNGDRPAALRAARNMFLAAVRGEHVALERLATQQGAALAASLGVESTVRPLPS